MFSKANKRKATGNLKALELSLTSKGQQIIEENDEEDQYEENILEVDKSYSDENVSSVVNAAFKRAKHFALDKKISANVSEQSSCGSTTIPHATSLPDSIDGGKTEVNDLISLPQNFETALRINQALQRRFGVTLSKLSKALEDNLKRQIQLKLEEEEQGSIMAFDKNIQEAREQYIAKPSSFSIPFFKDRSGLPAPMNNDAKLKVDQGYLDLYTTKTRTWMISEHNVLTKVIRKEWKEHSLKTWSDMMQNCEKRIKLSTSEMEIELLQGEIKQLESKIQYFLNTHETDLEIPKNSEIDWDKIAAVSFDGSRSAEDCRLFWENKLHPSISKDQWQEKEDIFIQQSVTKNESNHIDWEIVAHELNTGRTAFQCLQRWVSYIQPTLSPARWTPEDTLKLEDTISMLRIGSYIPWAQVTQHLTGFTAAQVQSRWRIVNPEQTRGPFTLEDDFLLIKGLTMFGLNFEAIAHYLPGRSKVQVRDRFKRALMPGLTSNPWTVREDKKIMTNCSLSNQHWRIVATAFPKRDACEIRVRFYTLHVWQESSNEKVLPPPLFPLSRTKNLKEIKDIRKKLINLHSCINVNKFLDKVSTIKRIPIKTLEHRRQLIRNSEKRKKHFKTSVKEAPKLKNKKKKGYFGPRTPSWPDMALIEYFLPGRPCNGIIELPEGNDINEYISVLGEALQLRPTQVFADDFLEDYSRLNLTNQDATILDKMTIEHSHAGIERDPECKACVRFEEDRPLSIPLIPPNHSTIGAFRSFLYNKQKLKEMESEQFLFFQVPKDQLNKLGEKPNTIISKKSNPKSKEKVEGSENVVSESSSNDKKKSTKKTSKGPQQSIVDDQFSAEEDAIEIPTDKEFKASLTNSELPHLCARPPPFSSKKKAFAEEDELLFHRFMALFFWPALFTLEKPSMRDFQLAENLVEIVKSEQSEVENETRIILDVPQTQFESSKYKQLDIDEQEELIEILEKEELRKSLFYRPICTVKKANDWNGAGNEAIPFSKRKKNILRLKRSLVMKKVWDSRRKGLCPDRKLRITNSKPQFRSTRSRRFPVASVETLDEDSVTIKEDIE